METTIDALLNSRVAVEQPKKGFRIAVDTILLAAAVQARAGEHVLDLGCGVGGAMLALATRVQGLTIHGLEKQPELADLCRANIARNNFKNMDVTTGDVIHLPGDLLFAYDHVMINPPYHEEGRHESSPDESKSIANTQKAEELEIWITSAARCLKNAGIMVMINRADRQAEILKYMKPFFGEAEILPLLPHEKEPAKRIIVRARKGEGARPVFCKPIILHRSSGGYTDQIESSLKHAKPVDFEKV